MDRSGLFGMECKKKFIFILSVIAATCFAGTPAAPLESRYSVSPPVIDGLLDDAVWLNAPVYSDFTVMHTGASALRQTELRIVHTNTAIYFGFKAYVPNDKLASPEAAHIVPPYATDCVELMIDPSGGSEHYFHFVINSINKRCEALRAQGGHVSDTSWTTELRSAVQRGQDYWTAEIELPYRSLELEGAQPESWSFNAARESYQMPDGTNEISSLAPNGAFHSAGVFRRLAVSGVDLTPYFWQMDTPAIQGRLVGDGQETTVKNKIKNLTQTPRRVKLEISFTGADGKIIRAEQFADFSGGEERAVAFAPLVLPESGEYQAAVTIRDRASNRILSRKKFIYNAAFVPIVITLRDPHYRNAIFATQKLDKIRYTVLLNLEPDARKNLTLISGIRRPGESKPQKSKSIAPNVENIFEFDAAPLPDGRWEIFAALEENGKTKDEITISLRKLPYKKNEVWRGKDGNWYVDGNKIFLLSSWGSGEISRDPVFNVAFRKEVEDRSLMFFNEATGFGFGAAFWDRLKKEGASPEILDIYRERARKAMDSPQLFGHYLIDEPDCHGYSRKTFVAIAEVIADEDPYHPIVISTGGAGITNYPDCGEINGFHCYPNPEPGKPMSNFKKLVTIMDKGQEFFAVSPLKQSIAYLHQGFNYGDCGRQNSRIPSYEELRNQNILAFILGAVGLLHYNRTEIQYPELYIGLPPLAAEQKIIGEEAVIQPDAEIRPVAGNKNLRMLGKINRDGSYWLIACNASDEPGEYEISWPVWENRMLAVLSENRQIQAAGGKIKETFAPYQARVYTDSAKDFKLRPIAEINAAIEAEYAKRAKPGNLACQRFENETVSVRASSNKFLIGRADNALWHLADGVTAGPPAPNSHDDGIITYCDATPDETPDWVELEFHRPVKAGRAVVYPVANSLKDYELQILRDGKYVTVASVRNAEGESQALTFEPVSFRNLRLLVTATRGPHSRIYEIEVYEK